jgi:glycosyltransferase involved in cell wall biosynthesis
VLGDAGIVLDSFSPTDLADTLVALLSDVERRRVVGRAGRDRVVTAYGAERTISQVHELLGETIRHAAEGIGE